jgi:hypothetical protein
LTRLSTGDLQRKIRENVTVTESGCWEWNKSFGSHGYGNIGTGGKRNETVHRVSLEVFKGLPDGLLALHSCDNRKCCNPDHLRAGTYSENRMDAALRGPKRVLTAEQAREIFLSDETHRALAERFGCSGATVFHIKRRRTWAHITLDLVTPK